MNRIQSEGGQGVEPAGRPAGGMRFAVDTGGTFTDLIVDTGAALELHKAHTTPHNPTDGIFAALDLAAAAHGLERRQLLARGELFIHGTTRAINALVTGNTARTALLCTAGHPDVLVLREGGRHDAFDFAEPFPEPLVPRALVHEVHERVGSVGDVVEALDEPRLLETIAQLRDGGVEAVAVSLLFSTVNPVHELRVGALLEKHLPGVPYTLSHQINPAFREYRRTSSTCMDASLKPLMTEYFESLGARLRDAGFGGRLLVVTSQGGMLDASAIAHAPIHSVNSGPAMAPVAGRFFAGDRDGEGSNAVVADTGGTTFDVSLIRDGEIPRTRETWIGPQYLGHITGLPSIDVRSVGAGGGSIAWVDEGGLLRVGPQSAGSVPGPACYGRGGEQPTVTDASVALGYIDPDFFLGGTMKLDAGAARAAIERDVAEPLGLTVEAAAAGILTLATENMVHAIEDVTVQQGVDPRTALLVGGGGAAGLNLVSVARRLGTGEVLIPEVGAALSAAGALLSDLVTEHAGTFVTSTAAFDHDGVNALLAELQARCTAFAEQTAPGVEARVDFFVDARYPRQAWELEVPLHAGRLADADDVAHLAADFHAAHERVFAISDRESPVEVVGWRARVSCSLGVEHRRLRTAVHAGAEPANRRVHFPDHGSHDAAVVLFEALEDGAVVDGPAIIESSFTTVVLDPGAHGRKRADGTLAITPA